MSEPKFNDDHFYRPRTAPLPRLVPSLDRCPTCKQPLGTRTRQLGRGRTCLDCKRTILRHEKFTISLNGLRHRNCEDPESYT